MDGVLNAYAAKVSVDGPAGYVHPVMKVIVKELDEHDNNGNTLNHNVKITTVLPIRDLETLQVKELKFGDDK